MTPAPEFSPEALLAHAGWMRALALGLVRDPHEADDVVQDAALAALLAPPPAGAALRPWLGQVVRRLAWRRGRARRRRADHEARASEPAGPEDAGETLARLDLQRTLLDCVRELEEPVRTTLVQRYFEGRSAADIAAKGGVPASTVRARLARGLELLRERLDRETGSRGAWLALVAPLVPREWLPAGAAAGSGAVTASTAAAGALTMTLAKLALVASAALVGGLAWWNLAPQRRDVAPVALAPHADVEVVAPAAPAPEPETPVVADARSAADVVDAPAEAELEAQPVPAVAAPLLGSFRARVVDAAGTPWAGAELTVHLKTTPPGPVRAQGTTDTDGRVEVEVDLPRFTIGPDSKAAGEFHLVVRRAGCATRRLEVLVQQDQTTELGEIVLEEAAAVAGRVLDAEGSAVAGAVVGALAAEVLEGLDAGRFARIGSRELDPLVARPASTDGSFELDDLPAGRVVLWAHAPNHRYARSEALELAPGARAEDVALTLVPLADTDRISGQVVGPDGKGRPASISRKYGKGASERLDFVRADMEGRFEFTVDDPETVYDLSFMDGYRQFANMHAKGLRGGDVDLRIVLGEGRRVSVRLLDPDGAPVSGAEVRCDEGSVSFQAQVEELAPGELRLECPAAPFRIEVAALGFRESRSALFEPDTIPDELEIRLQRAPRVVGTVTADGAPLAGATLTAHAYDAGAVLTVNGLRCTLSPWESGQAVSDAEGRFELFVDSDEPVVVRAAAAGWVDGESEPLDLAWADPKEALEVELALGRGGALEGRVLVPPGESAAGRIVGVHRGDGRPRSTRTAEDGTFRFEDLMPGAWNVLPLAAEVSPHGGAYASYLGSEPLTFDTRVEAGRTTRFDLELD